MTQRTQVVMATLVSIQVEEKHELDIENGFNTMKSVDNSLSSFKKNSNISKLNQNKNVRLDALSFEALTLSKKYYEKSDGYFNITIGSITKDLYRFGMDSVIPNKNDLANAKIDFEGLKFNTYEATLSEGIKVDLGGMGKGFAVDKTSEYLISKGIKKAIISASGDIRCFKSCKIDIQDPYSDGIILSFQTRDMNLGITTSGNYNRYVKDKSNNHLINPKTKKSQQNFSSITLVGDMKSSALDAYATAVSVMPKEEAYNFLNSLRVGYIVVEVSSKTVVKPADFFDLVLNSR